MNKKLKWKKYKSSSFMEEIEDDNDSDATPWDKEEQQRDGNKIKMMFGPFGLVQSVDLSKELNLWEGHVNFVMTVKDKLNIINILGVEGFKQLTPYRFRLAIARLYKGVSVRDNIEKALKVNNNQFNVKQHILNLVKQKLDIYPYWAIYFEKGKPMRILRSKTQNISAKLPADAEVYTSWDKI